MDYPNAYYKIQTRWKEETKMEYRNQIHTLAQIKPWAIDKCILYNNVMRIILLSVCSVYCECEHCLSPMKIISFARFFVFLKRNFCFILLFLTNNSIIIVVLIVVVVFCFIICQRRRVSSHFHQFVAIYRHSDECECMHVYIAPIE